MGGAQSRSGLGRCRIVRTSRSRRESRTPGGLQSPPTLLRLPRFVRRRDMNRPGLLGRWLPPWWLRRRMERRHRVRHTPRLSHGQDGEPSGLFGERSRLDWQSEFSCLFPSKSGHPWGINMWVEGLCGCDGLYEIEDHGDHIRYTRPGPGAGLSWRAARASDKPSASRVSTGSMSPSSHNRLVA